ncbi:MAG: hypothetical protein ACE149_07305 [Armatimonadota bacterium]
MGTQRMRWMVVPLVMAVAGLCLSAAVAAPPAEAGLSAEQLVPQGATVKFQVDVNGEAAMQLVGGMLDAAAEAVKEAAASGQGERMGQLAMAAPFIAPAKDLVKSVCRVTAVVMQAPPDSKGVINQYETMMATRHWTMLATTRAITGQDAAVYLAPGGKGVFLAVRPDAQQLIVALVTTREPIGDLLGQIVRAGGGKALPMLLAAEHRGQQPPQECAEKPDDQGEAESEDEAED